MTTVFTTEVKYNADEDDYYIEFKDEVISELGWNTGDTLEWIDNQDGSFTLRKKDNDQV